MKKINLFIILFITLFACDVKDDLDIPNWDIPFKYVNNIELISLNNQQKTVQIDKEESKQLIESFNNITIDDLYKVEDDLMYAMFPITVRINAEVGLSLFPHGILRYNNKDYTINLDVEFFDLLRNLDEKYNMHFFDWENEFLINEFIGNPKLSWVCVSPNMSLKHLYELFDISNQVDDLLTISNLLSEYRVNLNDVIETEDMFIKIIHINEDNVTAVAIKFKK